MPEARAEQTPGGNPPTSGPLDPHYTMVVKAILDGRVVPFLGAGVNLCGRPLEAAWQLGQYLPNGGELSTYLIKEFAYPPNEIADLLRVSQYIFVMQGSGPLYEKLHELFDADYPPTLLHQFFATLPVALRAKGVSPRHQLIVTTNYDDVLERAFRKAGEPFDLVTYVAEGEQRGKFLHWLPDGEVRLIEKPNEYRELSLDRRTVILKIHGAVDRNSVERSNFVITEDHYIDYLAHKDISNLVPAPLLAKLRRSHILFLGYGLRDWNLRVILRRIWEERILTYKSWAIQLKPDELDQKFWMKRDVEILNVSLEDYIAALSARVQALSLTPRPA